eukprot:Rhum_TRINITY_DN10271_c0_g1::Rhum_TRINITY_DN10271_c0_g1_i1::g.37661::m.37661
MVGEGRGGCYVLHSVVGSPRRGGPRHGAVCPALANPLGTGGDVVAHGGERGAGRAAAAAAAADRECAGAGQLRRLRLRGGLEGDGQAAGAGGGEVGELEGGAAAAFAHRLLHVLHVEALSALVIRVVEDVRLDRDRHGVLLRRTLVLVNNLRKSSLEANLPVGPSRLDPADQRPVQTVAVPLAADDVSVAVRFRAVLAARSALGRSRVVGEEGSVENAGRSRACGVAAAERRPGAAPGRLRLAEEPRGRAAGEGRRTRRLVRQVEGVAAPVDDLAPRRRLRAGRRAVHAGLRIPLVAVRQEVAAVARGQAVRAAEAAAARGALVEAGQVHRRHGAATRRRLDLLHGAALRAARRQAVALHLLRGHARRPPEAAVALVVLPRPRDLRRLPRRTEHGDEAVVGLGHVGGGAVGQLLPAVVEVAAVRRVRLRDALVLPCGDEVAGLVAVVGVDAAALRDEGAVPGAGQVRHGALAGVDLMALAEAQLDVGLGGQLPHVLDGRHRLPVHVRDRPPDEPVHPVRLRRAARLHPRDAEAVQRAPQLAVAALVDAHAVDLLAALLHVRDGGAAAALLEAEVLAVRGDAQLGVLLALDAAAVEGVLAHDAAVERRGLRGAGPTAHAAALPARCHCCNVEAMKYRYCSF